MKRRQFTFNFSLPQPELTFNWRAWLPSRGNVLFTLVLIGILLWVQSAGAVPFRAESVASTSTIAYQGRLADSSGNPLTDTLNMSFRLYNAASGGSPLWTEQWTGSNGVQVSDGLFNVMLGSLTPIPATVISGNLSLFLGIMVGTDDEMSPRVQLGSVPTAVQALTVPASSITSDKIADGAVTSTKLDPSVKLSQVVVLHRNLSSQFSSSENSIVSVPDLSIQVDLAEESDIQLNLQYLPQKNSDLNYYRIYLYRDDTEIFRSDTHMMLQGVHDNRHVSYVDANVPVGRHTYSVKVHPRGNLLQLLTPGTQFSLITFPTD